MGIGAPPNEGAIPGRHRPRDLGGKVADVPEFACTENLRMARDDLLDRFGRGRARHVVTSPEHTGKFTDIPGDYTRIVAGGTAPDWHDYAEAADAPARFAPDGETRGSQVTCPS